MPKWNAHRIEVQPGHAWHVVDSKARRPGKQTLVFIHGRFSSHDNWEKYMEYYRRKGHRVIAYDLDGHGKSTGDGKLTLEEHAEGLKKILDELVVKKSVLIGHSDGGVIAQQFAADHPEHVLALALINSYRQLPPDTRKMIKKLIEIHEEALEGLSIRDRLARQKLKLRALELLTEGRFGLRDLIRLFNPRQKGTLTALKNHSLAFNEVTAPLIPRPPPLCVLHTQQDFLVTRKPVDDFRQAYDDVETHILNKNTHFPHNRYPEWIKERLDAFLEGRAPSS